MSTLQQYVQQVKNAIDNQDLSTFKTLIEINPSDDLGLIRSQFNIPTEFDLYVLPEKFQPVIISYIKLMKSIYVTNDIKQTFNDYNELVQQLNKASVTQTNWINLPLMKSCKELIDIYGVMEKSFPEEIQTVPQDSEVVHTKHISSLELLANTINNSFKLSLNDKTLQLNQSKRIDIYFFLSCLIKIYFKLNNIELAKSIEKALKGSRFELPKLDRSLIDKGSAITYLYYSALLSLDDLEFSSSYHKLIQALDLLSYNGSFDTIKPQFEKILILLLPLNYYLNKKLPKSFIWKKFPLLNYIYNQTLFSAIKTGNLNEFENYLIKFQPFLLKKKLVILFEKMVDLCYINLIKMIIKCHNSFINNPSNHIIPLLVFQIGFNYSHKTTSYNFDQIECILANLIAEGKIKGYLSHGNKCIVMSKTVPFP